MNFRDWQQLSPQAAARELRTRCQARLSPAQQRAVIAALPSEAELANELARADRARPLGGIPFLVKDLFDVAGVPTFAGSTFLSEVRALPTRDSAIVTALRDRGAVYAGKVQMHEFAYGITGENPHYGDCEHPHFPGRTSGGSSSGSATAVAAGIAPLAIGTDTGGSIRVPAAFCGIYGFRLTPGTEYIVDGFPLSRSFDTAGWFTANREDMLATNEAFLGRIAVTRTPRGCYLDLPGVESDVATACETTAIRLGAITDISALAELRAAFANAESTYNRIAIVEAWEVHAGWAERFRERYDPAVWQRLNRMRGLTAAQLEEARGDMARVRSAWAKYFAAFDFLAMPAAPFAALTKAQCTPENRTRILAVTAPASLGGLPVLTLPIPLASGLTAGLQIVVKDPQSSAVTWALQTPELR